MRKYALLLVITAGTFFSCKKDAVKDVTEDQQSSFNTLLQSSSVATSSKLSVAELGNFYNSKRIACDVVSASIARIIILSENTVNQTQAQQIDVSWTSTTSSGKSVRYKNGYGFDAYYNVKGTSGTISFFVTVPKYGLYSYLLAAYTKPDLAGDLCGLYVN